MNLTTRATFLARTLGHRVAAGFLRNRNIPFDVAYLILFHRLPRA